jgi:hypothetical protein
MLLSLKAMSLSIQASLLSSSGSRRQLRIDNHKRQRGNDEPDAPLLLEEEDAAGEGDVVIGGKESDQGDHGAAGGLQQALSVKERGGALRVRKGI